MTEISEGAELALEHKFCRFGEDVTADRKAKDGLVIEGYASIFGAADQGGDIVERSAYRRSLEALKFAGRRVKMLWQHDPREPIGVWDEIREDAKGLWVKGRLLDTVARGQEAAALIEAGAIDGLSIGYRTLKSTRDEMGCRRLAELDLWEVSVVTFPMLPQARLGGKGDALAPDLLELAEALDAARRTLTGQD